MEDLILKLKTIFDDSGVNRLKKKVQEINAEQAKLNSAAVQIQKSMGGSIKEVTKQVEKANRELKKFKFEWLSVMFFGMAIQRAFGGILRASFATWSAVTEGTSQAGGAMTQLQAAWEFFKFSLFDALLNSGLFQKLVDIVLNLVDWWGDLSDSAKEFAANAVLVAAAIGGALFAAGTIKLGLSGVSQVLDQAATLKTQLQTIIGTVAIGYALVESKDAYDDFKNGKVIEGLIGSLSAAALAVGGIRILRGAKGGGALLAVGISLELVEKNKFFSTLFMMSGALIGFFEGAINFITKLWKSAMDNIILGGIASTIQKIADGLRASGFTALADKADKLAGFVRTKISAGPTMEDFINPIANRITGFSSAGEELDKLLQQKIQAADANANARRDGLASYNDTPDVNIRNSDQLARDIARYSKEASRPPKTYSVDDAAREGYGYYTPA